MNEETQNSAVHEVFDQIFQKSKYHLALVKNRKDSSVLLWNDPFLAEDKNLSVLKQNTASKSSSELASVLNDAIKDFSGCEFSQPGLKTVKDDAGNYFAFGVDKDQFVVGVNKELCTRQADLEKTKVLLKDMHHRVKNHLQIVCSMVDLDCAEGADKDIFEVADRIRDRIQVLAKLHETLYTAEQIDRVDLSSYLSKIAADLSSSYDVSVSMDVDVDQIFLDLNRALDCGLIVSELASNAFKHGFSDKRKGTISISGHLFGDVVEIRVENTGIPMNLEYDPLVDKSKGLQLVSLLTQQLNGKIFFSRSPHTSFKIQFKAEKS